MKITEKVLDLETQTEVITERNMTVEELAAYEFGLKELEATLKLQKEREEARKAVLEKLGLTEEEAKALLA